MSGEKIIEGVVVERHVVTTEEAEDIRRQLRDDKDWIGRASIISAVGLAAAFAAASYFFPDLFHDRQPAPNKDRFAWEIMTPAEKAPFWCVLDETGNKPRADWDGLNLKCPPMPKPR